MASPASQLLVDAAQARGLPVRRLSSEVVLCGAPPRQMLFHGLVGAGSGRSAHVLCADAEVLRRQLARADLAVWCDEVDDTGAAPIDVAVVGARPIVASVDSPAAASELAVAALAAVPDTRYASVRLREVAGEVKIETVDPALRYWATASADSACRVAAAIVAWEFGG
ncbi:hypothetical protein JQS43_02435 [Natronosporangium hydrolyticum]|uniref:Uncharacterized protein n=1 Tax=Natronosporangium hydrolyticum TaxID=2811111 RepID=A0A895YGM4_9ACTN|nr:hypothetical protein [Natronosporangium hydrolyticum]QSB15242.1 hypothetical protein JQS43_02435 [Natronosporangium hydrolyticum]